MNKAEHGYVFPPRDEWDVDAYPTDDVVDGYRGHSIHDPFPGDNHSPGYRWGFYNARKDATCIDDGYDHIRSAYIRMEKFIN